MQQLLSLIKDLADALQRAQLRFAFGGVWGVQHELETLIEQYARPSDE